MYIVAITKIKVACEVTSLSDDDLNILTRKTRVLINTVGPYHLYSSPVVEACALSGTHYLDVTGESPWVLEMINKYHATAKANKSIIIPSIGVESAPSDLLAFGLARLIRKQLSVGTSEVVGCIYEAKGVPSGGTLATALGIMDHYSAKELANAAGTWASSPVPGPKSKSSSSLFSTIFGVRSVRELGILTTSVAAVSNVPTVQRSWGLLDDGKFYGPHFSYQEYVAVRSTALGVAVHLAIVFGAVILALSPVRWLIGKMIYAPGQGASREAAKRDSIEYRAIATADQESTSPQRAFGKLRWDGGNYYFTGVCLAEAAMVLLKEDALAEKLGGGLLTPAMIAEPFIDRMTSNGMVFMVEMMP